MKRFAILTAVGFVLSVPFVAAQAPPPASSTPPAHKVKFAAPVKGWATVEVQRVSSKRNLATKEIVTVLKVKNTSKGAINLLKVEQYWYDKSSKQVSFGDYRHKKAPMQPGEVIELSIPAPDTGQISHDQLLFSHANGKVDAKQVKKIE